MAYISSKQDETFVAVIAGGGAVFEAELIEAAAEINTAFPARFHSLIADGDEHTFLLSNFDYAVGGTTVKQWVANMVAINEAWVTVID